MPRSRVKSRSGGAAPKKGEIFSATVRDLASDGRGVLSHPGGLTVFVAGVWPGETGSFRFTGLQNRVGTAEVVSLSEPAAERITAPCPYQGFSPGDCGGCPWQFIGYEAQLRAKQERVERAAARIGAAPVKPIWPAPHIFGYRNRAQLRTDGERLGFLSSGSHHLVDIEDCLVLSDSNRETLQQLREKLPEAAWRTSRKQKWNLIHIDESVEAGETELNQRLDFRQSNDAQNRAMRDWLAAVCAPLDKSAGVLELFCGSGNFTEVLAAAGFESIVASDVAGPAIDALQQRNLPGVRVLKRDLFKPENFAGLFRQGVDFRLLVLDPPRDGMRDLPALLRGRSGPEQIVYISCNVATLYRDLEQLQRLGYWLSEIQPLDQAPHTPHIEVLCQLQKHP